MDLSKELVPFVQRLKEAKGGMIGLAGRLASEDKWDEAEKVQTWARSLGQLTQQMADGEGTATSQGPRLPASPLPHFYINPADKLVMQGRSRNGGSYRHRVVRPHYDLIVKKVASLARSGNSFHSQDLQDRREMPVHEPLLVVRLLTKRGLITKVQKGKFALKDAARFLRDATELWSLLPRESDD